MEMEEIIAEVRRHPDVSDFTKDTLGASLVHIAAMAIIGQMGEEVDPDGHPWPPLSEAYAAWKAEVTGGEPMAVLFHRMRTLDEVEGLYRITATTIEQTYGTSEEARNEAEWFQEGSEKQNRPPRPFYAFNEMAFEQMNAWCDEQFAAAFA